jgi:hypothetical protein
VLNGQNPKGGTIINSPQKIQGDWKCIYSDRDYWDSYGAGAANSALHIRNDTIDFLEYPLQYFGYTKISYDSNCVGCQPLIQMKLRNDTLIKWTVAISQGKGMPEYNYYVRDNFDKVLLHKLKTDTLNPNALGKRWRLKKRDYGNYFLKPKKYLIKFPCKLPTKLIFSKKNESITNKRIVLLRIDGVLRDFKILYCSNKYGYVTLVSGKWRKETLVVNYYSKNYRFNRKGKLKKKWSRKIVKLNHQS